jgi:hypothetical protein
VLQKALVFPRIFATQPMEVLKYLKAGVAVQVDFGQKQKRLKPLLIWLETFQNWVMVAHTGFEPVISALRGRCPRPLDECALLRYALYSNPSFGICQERFWLFERPGKLDNLCCWFTWSLKHTALYQLLLA